MFSTIGPNFPTHSSLPIPADLRGDSPIPRRFFLSLTSAFLLRGLLLGGLSLWGLAVWGLAALFWAPPAKAHIVPPEDLHPVVESYRRSAFLLSLQPVPWQQVASEMEAMGEGLAEIDGDTAETFRQQAEQVLPAMLAASGGGDEAVEVPSPQQQRQAARSLFRASTGAVADALTAALEAAGAQLGQPAASAHFETARRLWAAFEHEIRSADEPAYRELGACWLEMSSALGSSGVLGAGVLAPQPEIFRAEAAELTGYLDRSFGDRFAPQARGMLMPLPAHSPTFDAAARVPPRLPPGSQINKQLPRPRQILNMAERGVDERETPLIALGDMAFDSPFVFGEPARSMGISCNTCHNKSITNPDLFIPGLSERPGGLDVSNSFFAPHANNGHFDHLDTPDLRGLRFTAPYGRNGRFESLRDFTRNVIVNEFNGPEPDPTLLDGLVAYMLEFDFLPNPMLRPDGSLAETAPAAARRGEELFHRSFPQMGNRSCATCHVPSDHFLDRRRHDLGSVTGTGPDSRDRALDTPTLLGIVYSPPYFHDGRLPTLEAVVGWFDEHYELNLEPRQRADLTAYLETVGGGTDAYENTVYTLEAELEEFSFFLSTLDFLRARGKAELVATTLETVAFELNAHKWDVQDDSQLPVLDRMVELVDEAAEAHRKGDGEALDARLAEYHRLYEEHREVLR
ncbi:MAG: cytochrome c peroxidase [Acidobacteriota bacterium]|nr:cytochrome c peroxidase [Acidobacteriota bacterium]